MEELLELKELVKNHQYDEALNIIEDLEEMSREDKLNKIDSFAVILLVHLIKQSIENRTTRSWTLSINNSIREINKINRRKKSGGFYADSDELLEILNDSYNYAIQRASFEIYDGRYDDKELSKILDKPYIINQALDLINQNFS
jgi:hypothetical protein